MASKGFSLPKGTPDAIVNVYIDAFKAILADEAFQKKAASTLGAYPQSFGADAAEIYKNALDLSPEAKTWLKTWIETNFQTSVTIN
jgi:tripartite-type tricarboxylate transporter receptor subunit TctC